MGRISWNVGLLSGLLGACGGHPEEGPAPVAAQAPAPTSFGPTPLLNERDPGPEVRALLEDLILAVERDPTDGTTHGELGLAYEANRFWTEAADCFRKARALEPYEPVWLLHQAVVTDRGGDTEGSAELLEECVEGFPDFAPALFRLADLHVRRGAFARAAPLTTRLLELRPRSSTVRALHGEVLLQSGSTAEAVTSLERSVELDPSYGPAQYLLGRAYRAAGRMEDAERVLSAASPGDKRFLPDAGWLRLDEFVVDVGRSVNRASELIASHDPRAAAELLERLRDRHPDDLQVLVNLAIARMHLGEPEAARELLDRAVEIGADQPMVWVNVAACAMQLGDFERAAHAAARTAELQPDFAQAHFLRAQAEAAQGDQEAAEAAFREAVRLDPQDAAVHREFGVLLLTLERREEALECFRWRARLAPEDWTAHADLARLALDLGDRAGASGALETLDRLGAPEHVRAAIREELSLERSR